MPASRSVSTPFLNKVLSNSDPNPRPSCQSRWEKLTLLPKILREKQSSIAMMRLHLAPKEACAGILLHDHCGVLDPRSFAMPISKILTLHPTCMSILGKSPRLFSCITIMRGNQMKTRLLKFEEASVVSYPSRQFAPSYRPPL